MALSRLVIKSLGLDLDVWFLQRQGLSWLRQKPKRIDAIKLRDLLLQVLYIKTKEQSDNFKKGFKLWEDRFGLELSRSTNRGKVFSDLLRTRSMKPMLYQICLAT